MNRTRVLSILLVLFCLAPLLSHAQTRIEPLKISWELPTTGCTWDVSPCDLKPLPATGTDALSAVEVYLNTVPIQDTSSMAPTVVLPGTPLNTVASFSAKVGDTIYIRIKARNGPLAKNLGPFSGQVTYLVKALPGVTPGTPTNVRVELIVGQPPGQ